jgi:hypothetical protein
LFVGRTLLASFPLEKVIRFAVDSKSDFGFGAEDVGRKSSRPRPKGSRAGGVDETGWVARQRKMSLDAWPFLLAA